MHCRVHDDGAFASDRERRTCVRSRFSVHRASNAWSDNPAYLASANVCGWRGPRGDVRFGLGPYLQDGVRIRLIGCGNIRR
jgi:hypothetical protein